MKSLLNQERLRFAKFNTANIGYMYIKVCIIHINVLHEAPLLLYICYVRSITFIVVLTTLELAGMVGDLEHETGGLTEKSTCTQYACANSP